MTSRSDIAIKETLQCLLPLAFGVMLIGVLIGALFLNQVLSSACQFANENSSQGWACFEFWLNRYQGIIGAAATLLAGWLAYRAAVTTAHRADERAKKAELSIIEEKIKRALSDMDALRIAPPYLENIAGKFDDTKDSAAAIHVLRTLHQKAGLSLSQSAAAAPAPHGYRITSTVTRLSVLGDRVHSLTMQGMTLQGVANMLGTDVAVAVEGLRIIANIIKDEIPKHELELTSLLDQRDALSAGMRAQTRP